MEQLLENINGFVWGIPTLSMILLTGIRLGKKTRLAQIRLFPEALRRFWKMLRGKEGEGSFQALCTALAATVGTGNIVGVAGAISLGGPGSIFWMWVCALLGMGIKYAEAVLAVRYRKNAASGELLAGPMYYMELGMGKEYRWLGCCYSVLGCVAAFGMGSAVQVNAVVESIRHAGSSMGYPQPVWFGPAVGILLGILAGWSLLGGVKRITGLASAMIPAASVAYIVLCLGAICFHGNAVPAALGSIITGAFQPKAVTGGVLGSAFLAIRVGASRGVFTNEAGMGTAAIAHGAADTEEPVRQGLMGIMEVFLDTVVICTMTALVILTAEVPIGFGLEEGPDLTARAFGATYGPWVSIPIAVFLGAFAFASMVGWGFYGLRCARYLMGERASMGFVLLLTAAGAAGALIGTGTLWVISEIFNALMALPNLAALWVLCPEVVRLTQRYTKGAAHR